MNQDFLTTCIGLADIYRVYLLAPTVEECTGFETDPWSSLKFFLLGYAFERQGRSPDYAPAAADTIDELRGSKLDAQTVQEAWAIFSQKLGNSSLNPALNPMCPKGTQFRWGYKGETRNCLTHKVSAVEFAASHLNGQCLTAWARAEIEADRVAEAHRMIRMINGIDVKVASFFLRDIATIYGLAPSKDRHLLMPVDTWIRFVVQ